MARVDFTVQAYPNETFSGTIARIAHIVDVKTGTMPVELNVNNAGSRLSSGVPDALWPVNRSYAVCSDFGSGANHGGHFVVRNSQRQFGMDEMFVPAKLMEN